MVAGAAHHSYLLAVAPAVSAELAVLEVSVVRAVSAALEASAVPVVLAELAAWVVQVTAPRNYRPEAAAAIPGSIILNIAVAPLTRIGLRQTGLAVRRAETRWRIARLAPGSRLDGRAAIYRAIGQAELAALA